MSKETNIYITEPDYERLTKLIEREREGEGLRDTSASPLKIKSS